MNPNEPFTLIVKLFDGSRTYIPATPSDLDQIIMESTAPALDIYFDNAYQGTWFIKEVVNENN
jgi:hypothetical protein